MQPSPKPWIQSRASVSLIGSDRSRHRKPIGTRGYTSRSSLASSTRSRGSAAYVRATVGHKRGVSFNHLRRQSVGSQRNISALRKHHSSNTEVTDDDGHTLRPVEETPPSTRYIRSKKTQADASQTLLAVPKPNRLSHLWTDDVRQLSSSLAQDCDDAFNTRSSRSSLISNSEVLSKTSTAPSSFQHTQSAAPASKPSVLQKSKPSFMDNNRPLPPAPTRSESVNAELIEARRLAELRKKTGGDDSPGYLDRMVSHIDRLIQPSSPPRSSQDRRTTSAPLSSRPLPSIYETGPEEHSSHNPPSDGYKDQQRRTDAKNGRVASAPEARNPAKDRFSRPNSHLKDTIRVVQPSESPVKAPAPLTIRKKTPQGTPSSSSGKCSSADSGISQGGHHYPYCPGIRTEYNAGNRLDVASELGPIAEDQKDEFANESNSGTIVKKKSTWFRRNSKASDELEWRMSVGGGNYIPSQSSVSDAGPKQNDAPTPPPPMVAASKKKFSFGRLFKKRSSRTDMIIPGKCCISNFTL